MSNETITTRRLEKRLLAAEGKLDGLIRTGSTVAVAGLATAANRNVTLTIKDENGTAVERRQIVGIKVTKASGSSDSGSPAVINTDLDTSDGLTVVSTYGEAVPDAAIVNGKNANLIAITKSDGTLTVNIKKTTTNSKFFVHFLLPDGTVETSAIVELNAS